MEPAQQSTNRMYIVPCMLTICSLFSGFYSIVSSFNGHFFAAAIAILVAGVFDMLDGRVARMTGSTSTFGMELDSLCDMVAFGVAPGLLAFLWALTPYGRYGWLAAFLYVAATALRLARFNAQAIDNRDSKTSATSSDFTGLPCPAAAGMIATSVMFSTYVFKTTDTVQNITLLLLVYLLSYLMVSSHRYLSFKHVEIAREKRFHVFIGLILLLILLASEPPITLFAASLIYISSGLVLALRERSRRNKRKQVKQEKLP
ncbi:CDP-diacylglycerol--serine O-phosphatidyltransferase [Desulfobulbus rhabdoformis]|uniref:CDP-diacylglycerol--serine O-phosphatidyltransferase n=1 Tax=Desulfobulbus rhabdoformis TaxID=34032 RepID=UPI001962F671|nr:CDP-diacylglycerol--serine O-phosphatidyltransferase [Desulfobulbus rhabdoformis]MBM9615837.1 CDP-diacylglycerol--serine O-phosphatidyltransferase [Desulfobulbus rhabdoformis]